MWTKILAPLRCRGINGGILSGMMAFHAQQSFTAIGDDCPVHKCYSRQRTNDMIVRRIGARKRLAVGFMTGLAVDYHVSCIGCCPALNPANESIRSMATDATFASGTGRIACCDGVHRVLPFGDVNVIWRRVMALCTITGSKTDGDEIGIAEGGAMLAAGAVTVFTLDVGQIRNSRIIRFHACPIAGHEVGRKGPAVLRRHVVKPAVHGVRIGIITNRVTFDAAGAVMTA